MEEKNCDLKDDDIEFAAAIDGRDDEVLRIVSDKISTASEDVRSKYLKKRLDGKSLFQVALEKCTWNTVHRLIESGFDPRTTALDGQNALMMVVVHSRLDLLKNLLHYFAPQLLNEVKKTDNEGNTVLHLAVLAGDLSVVEFLIEYKEIKEIVNFGKGEAGTALHRAAVCKHPETVQIAGLLSKIGASVNVTNQHKQTPLHVACANDNPAMVQDLLNKNANKEAKDKYLQTPLHLAASANASEAIEKLFEIGQPPKLDVRTIRSIKESFFEHSPLHSAVFAGAKEAVEKLMGKGARAMIDACDCFGRAVFPIACWQGDLSLVELIEAYRPTLQVKDHEEFMALHFACRNKTSDGPQIVEKLIGSNFPLEAKAGSKDGEDGKRQLTPFLVACKEGTSKILDVLVHFKVDTKAKQFVKYNKTSDELDGLKVAVKNDNVDAMNFLVSKDFFRIDKETSSGNGGLTLAGDLLRLAVCSGSAKAVAYLLDRGVDIDAQDQFEKTPLHYAAQSGQHPIIKLLIERGANVEIRDRSTKLNAGRTAEKLAELKKKPETAKYIRQLVIRQDTLMKRLPHDLSELVKQVDNLYDEVSRLEEIQRNLVRVYEGAGENNGGNTFSPVNVAPKSTHFRKHSLSQFYSKESDNNNNNNSSSKTPDFIGN